MTETPAPARVLFPPSEDRQCHASVGRKAPNGRYWLWRRQCRNWAKTGERYCWQHQSGIGSGSRRA